MLLYSDMGVIPYNEKQPSGKIFNFWIGHTNFDITHNVKETIEAVLIIKPKILTTILFIPLLYLLGWIMANPLIIVGLGKENISLVIEKIMTQNKERKIKQLIIDIYIKYGIRL